MHPRPSNIPPEWKNQNIILYHGTSKHFAESILNNGIDLDNANPRTDFGREFYTSTIISQAQNWAWRKAISNNDIATILRYELSRESLSRLECLWFIDGGSNSDFWSFVFHCRNKVNGHGREGNMLYYDLVAGPVAAFWQDKVATPNADQISFHTKKALSILSNPEIILVED